MTGSAHPGRQAAALLGRVGVWSGALGLMPATGARDAVRRIEELGYGALWYPEPVGAKESLTHAALLLSWGERIAIASAIVNIWARDAIATANAGRTLSEAHPGRYLLGLGASNEVSVPARGHEFRRPYSRMRGYLDEMDAAPYTGPEPDEPARRFLAALGPKMLALAGERSVGAHPYFVPVEHTAFAREILGPGPLLAVEQAVVLDSDRAEARRRAAPQLEFYLSRRPYRANLARFGWTEEEMAGGGSDGLLAAIFAFGDLDAIEARVHAHLDAGADHVCIQPIGADAADPGLDQLERLAPALLAA